MKSKEIFRNFSRVFAICYIYGIFLLKNMSLYRDKVSLYPQYVNLVSCCFTMANSGYVTICHDIVTACRYIVTSSVHKSLCNRYLEKQEFSCCRRKWQHYIRDSVGVEHFFRAKMMITHLLSGTYVKNRRFKMIYINPCSTKTYIKNKGGKSRLFAKCL